MKTGHYSENLDITFSFGSYIVNSFTIVFSSSLLSNDFKVKYETNTRQGGLRLPKYATDYNQTPNDDILTPSQVNEKYLFVFSYKFETEPMNVHLGV